MKVLKSTKFLPFQQQCQHPPFPREQNPWRGNREHPPLLQCPLWAPQLMGAGGKWDTPKGEQEKPLGWDSTGLGQKLQRLQNMRRKGRELETPSRVQEKEMGHRTQPQQGQSGTGECSRGEQGHRELQFYRTRNAENNSVRTNLASNEKSADWEWIREWEG